MDFSTFGLSEPVDDIGADLIGFETRVTAAPLVLDGHLERRPPREN